MASKTERKERLFKQQYLSPLQLRILELLRENGPMTRDQICEEFGFKKRKIRYIYSYPDKRQPKETYHMVVERYDKRTTIHDNIVKLQKRHLLVKYSKSNGKRGRPLVFYKLKEVEEDQVDD